jgi:hypothetical protein
MEHIRPPPELDFALSDDGNLPERWREWEQTLRLYLDIVMHGRYEEDLHCCSALLYIIGQDGREEQNRTFVKKIKGTLCTPRKQGFGDTDSTHGNKVKQKQ